MTSTDDLLALEADQRRRDAINRDEMEREAWGDLNPWDRYAPRSRYGLNDRDRDAEAADRAGHQKGSVR